MAPPPPAASAAAEMEPLEVRCVGCGETLEVDRGLTEFICPDCATPQSLPPELMPKPPRRKALPLPRGAADVRGARLPCGACGALLSVPVGLPRCACPLCGAELAVDTAQLRHYLLSSAAAADAVPVVPLGASSSGAPILRACETQIERPSRFSTEPAESSQPYHAIDEGEVDGVNRVTGRYKEQQSIYPGRPGIASAEKRQGQPLNQHQAQDIRSGYSGRTKQAHQGHMDHVIEPPQDSVNSALLRESGCRDHINGTSAYIDGTAGRSIHSRAVNVEDRHMQTPIQIMQKSQKQHSCYVISPEHAQAESASGAIYVQEKQQVPLNEANHREDVRVQLVSETIAGDNDRRGTRQVISLNNVGAEERHGRIRNEATQQVQKDQSGSVARRELDNQVTHVEKEQPGCHRVRNRKRGGLIAALNPGLQLRRSKRLAKDVSAVIDKLPAIDTDLTHREIVVRQASSPNGHMPGAITDDGLTESEPDGQHAASPALSDPPDMDTMISNLCTSPSPRHEIPQTSSNDLENSNLATPPSTTNPGMSDPEHFARNYIPPEVRRALAKVSSQSPAYWMMSQLRSDDSDEAYLQDIMDSEGQELPPASKKNGRRPRSSTLCLKVWTLPKGVCVPVTANSIGEPIGKEATTLTNFLGILARDGTLAPLAYHSWKHVPEKNKAAMYHIVKLKFDIATLDESWIIKSIGKKWKTWKFILKKKHFDTHETEEERLADRNPRVLEEQWRFLVAYWSTEKAQALSAKNKANTANITTFSTSGTKSFARLLEEERAKRPNKDDPTHEEFFLLTHTPKDGKPMKKAAADAIARFREQCQKQAEGSGNSSDARNFRLGACSKRPRKRATLKASLTEAMEAKRRAEEEAATLREKMIAMEESQRKMQEDKMIPDKRTRNRIPISNFQEKRTGEPSAPPGFPLVQEAASDDEIFGAIF